jgi:hypothetical protein
MTAQRHPATEPELPSVGEQFARAVATKDHERVTQLLHPALDFRGMTPGRVWDAEGPEDVVRALRLWFADSDVIEGVDALETDSFADRERVGYRLRVRNDEGNHLVEQQAYLSVSEGRIVWMRIMCSGFRRIS